MITEGLEKLTIEKLKKFNETMTMTMEDALPIVRKFKKDNNLTDAQTRNACACANRLFGDSA